jgi:hypothetical protein
VAFCKLQGKWLCTLLQKSKDFFPLAVMPLTSTQFNLPQGAIAMASFGDLDAQIAQLRNGGKLEDEQVTSIYLFFVICPFFL